MYTQEQILDMYFDRNQQAVSATSQMYGAKLTRFADTMIAHEDAWKYISICPTVSIPAALSSADDKYITSFDFFPAATSALNRSVII